MSEKSMNLVDASIVQNEDWAWASIYCFTVALMHSQVTVKGGLLHCIASATTLFYRLP